MDRGCRVAPFIHVRGKATRQQLRNLLIRDMPLLQESYLKHRSVHGITRGARYAAVPFPRGS